MTGASGLRALVIAAGLAVATLSAAAESGPTVHPAASPPGPQTIRVAAAASLTEVVEALAHAFEAEHAGARVELSFGASSDLARQIRDGAPADVFISASPEWVDFLRESGALAGEPLRVARNALVCVAKERGPGRLPGARDPRALLAGLEEGDLVAIADAGVPAGEYARGALAKLGLEAAFEPRLVGQKDVRAVLHAVEQGEVAAGFVYATDAKLARVELLFAFDPATHPAIEYLAVVIRNPDGPGDAGAAQRFVDFLGSPPARARLSAAGFVLP